MTDRVLAQVAELLPEAVEFLQALIRVPTINPPGEFYKDVAGLVAEQYGRLGYRVEKIPAEGHPDHSARYPRVNVLGRMESGRPNPCLHFNGHLDVVPAGSGWTVDPFAGGICDGKLYGRGASDMKAGIAASLYAVEAIRRSGIRLTATVEQSATVDEESGGFAGVAYLAEHGYLNAGRQQHVIITEAHGPGRICLGHRGVYWFDVVMHGHIAHGSMPFNGENAIDRMNIVLNAVNTRLRPRLAARTTRLPVAPLEARQATLNLNSIFGGQAVEQRQTPCVPDRCTAVFDRRFLPEEDFPDVKKEFEDLLDEVGLPYELHDRMIVHPNCTSQDSSVSAAVGAAIQKVFGHAPEFVASPGTYDQKHFVGIAGVKDCISYGPGILDLAHQPDEYVSLKDFEHSMQVMALAALQLIGGV